MTEKSTPPERFSLSRWSRRKLEANAEAPAAHGVAPGIAPAPSNAMATALPTAPAPAGPPELPSVDSLNFHSDFTAFLRPEVDENLKRAALKQLFRDPRFNVMDGLDIYIDDYTKPDPIAPDVLKDLLQRFSTSSSPPGDAPAQGEVPSAVGAAVETPPAPQIPAASAEPTSAAEAAPEESSAPRSTS
jgi:Protein of unknown function (DUF3306)